MNDYKTILDMIEAVDPADTNKLAEIDARVFCIDLQHQFISYNQSIVTTLAPSGKEYSGIYFQNIPAVVTR